MDLQMLPLFGWNLGQLFALSRMIGAGAEQRDYRLISTVDVSSGVMIFFYSVQGWFPEKEYKYREKQKTRWFGLWWKCGPSVYLHSVMM